jgi:hypothetical protein
MRAGRGVSTEGIIARRYVDAREDRGVGVIAGGGTLDTYAVGLRGRHG